MSKEKTTRLSSYDPSALVEQVEADSHQMFSTLWILLLHVHDVIWEGAGQWRVEGTQD